VFFFQILYSASISRSSMASAAALVALPLLFAEAAAAPAAAAEESEFMAVVEISRKEVFVVSLSMRDRMDVHGRVLDLSDAQAIFLHFWRERIGLRS
jgi:hypothetical protein